MTELKQDTIGRAMLLLIEAAFEAEKPRQSAEHSQWADAQGEVTELEAARQELDRRMINYITEKKRRVNDVAPIHRRLPTEILIRITAFYLLGSPQSHFHRLHTIAQVCTRWTGIAKEPTFWGVIDSSYTLARIRQALSISNNSPLDIHYRYDDAKNLPSAAVFIDVLVGHTQRWRSVELEFWGFPSDWNAVLTSRSAPILDSLTIDVTGGHPVRMTSFGGSLATIRHLSLMAVSLPWKAGGLFDLCNLHLSALERLSPSADQLLEILRSSPALETLSLSDLRHDHLLPPGPPIDLFALTDLRLAYLSQQYTHYILASLRFPSCKHLDIEPDGISTAPIFDSSTEHVTEICRDIIASTSHVNVALDATSPTVSTSREPSKGSLNLYLGTRPLSETIPWLMSNLGSPLPGPDIGPEWNPHLDLATFDDLRPMLQHFHTIISITVCGGRSENMVPLFQFLATPADAGSPFQWPLPKLHILDFMNVEVPVTAMIAMARTRYGRHLVVGNMSAKEPVVPLTRLEVLSNLKVRSRHLTTLRGILGPKVVEWRYDGDSEMEESESDSNLDSDWEEE